MSDVSLINRHDDDMPMITIDSCLDLRKEFLDYCDTAEQREFPLLAMVQVRMDASIDIWRAGTINQKEARAMFRVVLKTIGKDFSKYAEK